MFDAPRPASPTPAALQDYIQPDLGYGLRIWWAFYWPTVLCQFLLTFGVNKVIGRYLEDPLLPLSTARALLLVARLDAFFFYYVFAFLMIGALLRRNFRHFRIRLLSTRAGGAAEELPPNFRRTARVWWTFCWRAVVYRIIAAFAISFPLSWVVGFLQAIFPRVAGLLNMSVQVLLDAAIGMFVIYSSILDEDISDFRVALVPRAPSPAPAVIPSAPENLARS